MWQDTRTDRIAAALGRDGRGDVIRKCVGAFSGLFAPHWRPDARGVIVGMSRFHTRAHLARAALESICYQSKDVVRPLPGNHGSGPERRKDVLVGLVQRIASSGLVLNNSKVLASVRL